MNKKINDLKISKENKILFLKMEKKIPSLEKKVQEYFDSSLIISSDAIKNAFSNNVDLLKILDEKKEIIKEVKNDFHSIREKYQIDFSQEKLVDVTEENKLSITQNILDSRTQLVNSEKKMFTLNKKIKYIKKKNKKRKMEMDQEFKLLENKIKENELMDISFIKEDLNLMKNFIDEDEMNNKKLFYLFPIIVMIFSVFFMAVIIWKII